MSSFTIHDLTRIMRETAGEDESVDLNGDILNTPFDALGYDSIARLEAAGHITREYGVELPDDVVSSAETPSQLLKLINQSLSEPA